jgi:hypothetical protein
MNPDKFECGLSFVVSPKWETVLNSLSLEGESFNEACNRLLRNNLPQLLGEQCDRSPLTHGKWGVLRMNKRIYFTTKTRKLIEQTAEHLGLSMAILVREAIVMKPPKFTRRLRRINTVIDLARHIQSLKCRQDSFLWIQTLYDSCHDRCSVATFKRLLKELQEQDRVFLTYKQGFRSFGFKNHSYSHIYLYGEQPYLSCASLVEMACPKGRITANMKMADDRRVNNLMLDIVRNPIPVTSDQFAIAYLNKIVAPVAGYLPEGQPVKQAIKAIQEGQINSACIALRTAPPVYVEIITPQALAPIRHWKSELL